MSFQNKVNAALEPGIDGDFASNNHRSSVVEGDFRFVAGPIGVVVGRFAWALSATGVVTNTKPAGPSQGGFVGRGNIALITTWLAESGLTVQSGTGVTLYRAGDFYAKFAAPAVVGQKVFANDTDGTLSAAAAGATVSGSTETPFFIEKLAAAGEYSIISTRG